MAAVTTSESCWTGTVPAIDLPPLPGGGVEADVAVIGAGLVGITTALMLVRAGRSVVVLEARQVGRQVTGGTTAKVTVQHGLIYRHLIERFGTDGARVYAESNLAGLDWIAEEVRAHAIACDFETRASHLYTRESRRVADLEREAEACAQLGLPVRFHEGLALPYPVSGALSFDGQAQFHPIKYLAALADAFQAAGGRIHENTRVLDVREGRPCRLATDRGSVSARDVIVATNIPFLDRGGFFAKAFPYRHMAVAGPVADGAAPDGMFLGVDEPTRSFRTVAHEGGRLLAVIGEAFPTGHGDASRRLADLQSFASRHFGVTEFPYRWGNQDYYAADRVPYVGRLLPTSRHIRVATGFNAWGITSGTAAAMILTDAVLGRPNPWARFYDATRLKPRASGRRLLEKNLHVAVTWGRDRIGSTAERDAEALAAGDGGIVRAAGKDAAGYRDQAGTLHLFAPACPHMGCKVVWNGAEASWDCPCHGSRFTAEGEVLSGPAVERLRRL